LGSDTSTRFNNELFSRNLNQNMTYIALHLEKNCKNLGALEVVSPDYRVITYTYC